VHFASINHINPGFDKRLDKTDNDDLTFSCVANKKCNYGTRLYSSMSKTEICSKSYPKLSNKRTQDIVGLLASISDTAALYSRQRIVCIFFINETHLTAILMRFLYNVFY